MNNPSISQQLGTAGVGTGQPSQPLQLKEGQMFHGKIQHLFPGDMAEVQIGNSKLHAKLEVPLKAGDAYYFQVKSTDPELQLKIVSGPHAQGESQSAKIGNLLDTLQLPKTPEMRALVNHFMKQQIPITKDTLMAAEALLKQTPQTQQPQALESIGKLAALKLPITASLFQAMMGVETKASLQMVLDQLQTALTADKTISSDQKQGIQTALQQVKQPLLESSGEKLLAQTVFTALDKAAPPSARFQAVQLLKTAGILPPQTSLANLPEMLAKLVSSSSNTQDQQSKPVPQQTQGQVQGSAPSDASRPAEPKAAVQQLINALQQSSAGNARVPAATASELQRLIQQTDLPASVKGQLAHLVVNSQQTNEPASALLAKVSDVLFSESARQLLPALQTTPAQNMPGQQQPASAPEAPIAANPEQKPMPALMQALMNAAGSQEKLAGLVRQAMQSEAPAIQSFLAAADASASEEVTGDIVKQAIQSVLSKLGVNYEAGLTAKNPQITQIQESLKPQLIALTQEGVAGAALREAAETVVSRLNGQPLQSTETGAQQQIIMQVPLQLQGKRIDATLEWKGRMKENGKIDPDHARILFYLDLETIQKTVVDMQVQNKVVTLTIFNNDNSLKQAGALLQKKLEEGLDMGGYRLSAVRFKPFQEVKSASQSARPVSESGTQGVDFRI